MSQGFKLRFDQMRDNNPAKTESEPENDIGSNDGMFHNYGHARNLCLVWPDGRQSFFNYAYLVSANFHPKDDINLIQLNFSSHEVTITGYSLEQLFLQLLDHLPRIIKAIDRRYVPSGLLEKGIVVEIQVEEHR